MKDSQDLRPWASRGSKLCMVPCPDVCAYVNLCVYTCICVCTGSHHCSGLQPETKEDLEAQEVPPEQLGFCWATDDAAGEQRPTVKHRPRQSSLFPCCEPLVSAVFPHSACPRPGSVRWVI